MVVLRVEQVTALLTLHHAGAAEAAVAWAAAGLHVAHEVGGLTIRTPGPEYRRVGQVGRDYWAGNVHSRPYEAITRDGEYSSDRRTRRLDALPLDLVAAAAES